MIFETLCRWYLSHDRYHERIAVPVEEMRQAILELAKAEGRSDRMPWETGQEYEERMQRCSAQTA